MALTIAIKKFQRNIFKALNKEQFPITITRRGREMYIIERVVDKENREVRCKRCGEKKLCSLTGIGYGLSLVVDWYCTACKAALKRKKFQVVEM